MNADQQLRELVSRLQQAAGTNLLSLILYGSAVTGEFQPKHSDLNVLCILKELGSEELLKLHPAAAWWAKKGHPAPLFLTLRELEESADVFAIELLDIKSARRILYGKDVIEALMIPMDLHRMHVERELRNNAIRLRQRYVVHSSDSRRTLELMTASISTFVALFRHAVIALGAGEPPTKRAAVDRAGSALGFDPAPFHAVLDIRERRKRGREVDVQATFVEYLRGVVKATEEMDRRLSVPPRTD